LSGFGTSFSFRPDLHYETTFQRAHKTTPSGENGAVSTAAPLRDPVKYGEFTAGCDLPHRRHATDLHPIGYENPFLAATE
jgi:hypothetical protein